MAVDSFIAPGDTLVLTPQQAGLLEQLLELSSAFVQRHSFRMKYYVLSNQLLQKALILVNCRPRHVALGALPANDGDEKNAPPWD